MEAHLNFQLSVFRISAFHWGRINRKERNEHKELKLTVLLPSLRSNNVQQLASPQVSAFFAFFAFK
jgi:hypothetical protein